MQLPSSNNLASGKIAQCTDASAHCHYSCCCQIRPSNPRFTIFESLLLHPGELAQTPSPSNRHIEIVGSLDKGELGFCLLSPLERLNCGDSSHYKPLDCRSYPFFPVIRQGSLVLAIDSRRCPLVSNLSGLTNHYRTTLNTWKALIETNSDVVNWITAIRAETHFRIVEERAGVLNYVTD